jgi:hypothetical protein
MVTASAQTLPKQGEETDGNPLYNGFSSAQKCAGCGNHVKWPWALRPRLDGPIQPYCNECALETAAQIGKDWSDVDYIQARVVELLAAKDVEGVKKLKEEAEKRFTDATNVVLAITRIRDRARK